MLMASVVGGVGRKMKNSQKGENGFFIL